MSDSLRWQRLILPVFLLALALLAAAACGGGADSPTAPAAAAAGGGTGGGGTGDGGTGDGGGTTPPPPPPPLPGPGKGTLAIRMTDAPIDDLAELNVFIEELKVKPDGSPVERFASNIGLVNLLTLQDGVTALLGQESVAAGKYQFIELLLNEDESYVVEKGSDDQLELQIPSRKAKIAGGPFEVPADGTTAVLFDFDAEKSLKRTGNGRYQLKPSVTIVQVVVSSD